MHFSVFCIPLIAAPTPRGGGEGAGLRGTAPAQFHRAAFGERHPHSIPRTDALTVWRERASTASTVRSAGSKSGEYALYSVTYFLPKKFGDLPSLQRLSIKLSHFQGNLRREFSPQKSEAPSAGRFIRLT